MKLIDRLRSVIKTPEVEFLCDPQDYNVIPEPYPARKLLPEWYKQLPPKIGKQNKLNNSTIKRCAPFLDAMSVGWIIPLAADLEIITNDNAGKLESKSSFYKTILESHTRPQLDPPDGPQHPSAPKPPMKFLNYWFIKLPPGYSALFVAPLNRVDPRFQCIAGMVDDGYMGNGDLEYINFPFIFNQPNYTGIIKAGTPLVQMIPIKRDRVLKSTRVAKVKQADQNTLDMVNRTRRRSASHESMYRDKLWVRK